MTPWAKIRNFLSFFLDPRNWDSAWVFQSSGVIAATPRQRLVAEWLSSAAGDSGWSKLSNGKAGKGTLPDLLGIYLREFLSEISLVLEVAVFNKTLKEHNIENYTKRWIVSFN